MVLLPFIEGLLAISGKMGFCPYFKKNLAQCPYFETIKHRVSVLKLDFKKIKLQVELNFVKIELQVELNFNKVEFYAYFATYYYFFLKMSSFT